MTQKIAILGAGLSGQAAARLVEVRGDVACVFDQQGGGACDHFDQSLAEDFDFVVISPGFSAEHPWRVAALQSSTPVYGELGFAAQYWKGKILAVTGTNGKTTVADFLTRALNQAGETAVATGNIGYPFSAAVATEENTEEAYAVLEVSSFQAELPMGLELDGLVWTNFAEDHLDRYASMTQYFEAKACLLNCLSDDGVCVVGPQVGDWLEQIHPEVDISCVVRDEPALLGELLETSAFYPFPQRENFILIAELWRRLGFSTDVLIETAHSFELAAHRLACVAQCDGVRFWDDSKATNFHAALAAISSMDGPVFWIGGGQSKGGDVEGFAQSVAGSVEAIFTYGDVGVRIAEAVHASAKTVVYHEDFGAAVLAAAEAASGVEGANVLLSPGFSSFDQFASYEGRGKCFISTVLSLNGAQAAH